MLEYLVSGKLYYKNMYMKNIYFVWSHCALHIHIYLLNYYWKLILQNN